MIFWEKDIRAYCLAEIESSMRWRRKIMGDRQGTVTAPDLSQRSCLWDSIVLGRGRGKYGLDPWLEWNERRATKKNLDTPEIRV